MSCVQEHNYTDIILQTSGLIFVLCSRTYLYILQALKLSCVQEHNYTNFRL